jgi:hypothetical protein
MTKTSTFSYIVVGFTNIRTLNGSMQHKVLKYFKYFENIFLSTDNQVNTVVKKKYKWNCKRKKG